ncbi:MAG: hypothetical protein A2W25_16410 [candidate division Zixibacteria bacterium RBG_16_53_22]|nr:MAG: hypothetical protein A2W25_16410 [candidate division Zixibacteria bacterium RBG_16_53_22]
MAILMKSRVTKTAIAITPVESIQQMIFIVRGQKVMLSLIVRQDGAYRWDILTPSTLRMSRTDPPS